ncbi:MAG: histidine kinase, partial [Planctomycetes bacterium]|nr:histidine kinase [Planctomycetota bacterium]
AGVAHEINNPLAIISAETGVIRDMFDPQFDLENTPEKITEGLDYIDEAVFRARTITQKLLDLSRRNQPNLTPCNVNKILDEAVSGLKEKEFKVSNIELIRKLDSELPDALIDPDQVRQVFLNIINNAGDAIEGSGTIMLNTASDGEFVRVTITDTGKGMTNEQINKIFLPFFTTKEVGKGTGLGLSISYSIVEAMGGRIEVQSLPGKGSSFTIVLPIHQVEMQPNA